MVWIIRLSVLHCWLLTQTWTRITLWHCQYIYKYYIQYIIGKKAFHSQSRKSSFFHVWRFTFSFLEVFPQAYQLPCEKAFRGSKHRLTRADRGCLGIYFLMEYMESLISINYPQVRDEVIGHTHICSGIFGLPFLRGGSGGSNQKNQATRCLLGSGHLKSLCLLVKRQIHQAENTCANSSSINSKSTETWIIIGRLITARMWFWGFCRHISMEIPPKYCNPDQKTLNSYDHLQPKHVHDLKQENATWTLLKNKVLTPKPKPLKMQKRDQRLNSTQPSPRSSGLCRRSTDQSFHPQSDPQASHNEGIPPTNPTLETDHPTFRKFPSEPNHFQGYPPKKMGQTLGCI